VNENPAESCGAGVVGYNHLMSKSERYERQLIIEGWGDQGQNRLSRAVVGVAGIGGLGSPVCTYLAAAGVGTLEICDFQDVELSNLNRQILYNDSDIGSPKVVAAADRLSRMNPDIAVVPHHDLITDDSVDRVYGNCDLIVDCLDNPETRHVMNRYCVAHGIPLIHAGVMEFYGQIMLIRPPKTACLGCFFPHEISKETPIPIVGSTAGVMGAMEANLAIRYLLGMEEDSKGQLISVDLSTMEMMSIDIPRNPDCPVCGE
jgi:molybdopterin/thiamine biosynthesis adenylyltransferase